MAAASSGGGGSHVASASGVGVAAPERGGERSSPSDATDDPAESSPLAALLTLALTRPQRGEDCSEDGTCAASVDGSSIETSERGTRIEFGAAAVCGAGE